MGDSSRNPCLFRWSIIDLFWLPVYAAVAVLLWGNRHLGPLDWLVVVFLAILVSMALRQIGWMLGLAGQKMNSKVRPHPVMPMLLAPLLARLVGVGLVLCHPRLSGWDYYANYFANNEQWSGDIRIETTARTLDFARMVCLPVGLLMLFTPLNGAWPVKSADSASLSRLARFRQTAAVAFLLVITILLAGILLLWNLAANALVMSAVHGIQMGMKGPAAASAPTWNEAARAWLPHASIALSASAAALSSLVMMNQRRRAIAVTGLIIWPIAILVALQEIAWCRDHGGADLSPILGASAGLPSAEAWPAILCCAAALCIFWLSFQAQRAATRTGQLAPEDFVHFSPWPIPMMAVGGLMVVRSLAGCSSWLGWRLPRWFTGLFAELSPDDELMGMLTGSVLLLLGFRQLTANSAAAKISPAATMEFRYWPPFQLVMLWLLGSLVLLLVAESAGQFCLALWVAPNDCFAASDVAGSISLSPGGWASASFVSLGLLSLLAIALALWLSALWMWRAWARRGAMAGQHIGSRDHSPH